MPLDALAGKLIVPTRDEEVNRYLRDYLIRNPGARTDPGSMPYIDAQAWADANGPNRYNAVTIANGVSRTTMKGTQLDDEAKRLGTFRLQPVGGSGFVIIGASSGGVPIVAGDLLAGPNNTRYKALQSGTFGNGAQVPIIGVTVGPSTNLPAGTVVKWVSPRIGLQPTATVAAQANGAGLQGGNLLETDDQLRARLDYIAANPSQGGNDAHYQSVLMVTPGLAVQQAFTIPCVNGPGAIAWTILLRPPQPGASRIPSAAQLAIAAAYLQQTTGGAMPADDGAFSCTVVANPVTLGFQVLWAPSTAGWTDASPFPTYQGANGGGNYNWQIGSFVTPSATTFTIKSVEALVTPTTPPVGGSFAVFDLANLVFRRKKILSATSDGSGGFTIVVDTTQGISDANYVPIVGQQLSPWSDSLNTLIPAIVPYFDTLGVGEQFAVFPDPGLRQRRSPANPQYWPSSITNRVLGGTQVPQPPQGPQQNQPAVPTLLSLPNLGDVILVEPTLPYACPVGTPAVSFNLNTFGDIAVYPE